MYEEYWLINSRRSRVKRFTINKQNADKFFKYIFIDTAKIVGVLGKATTSNAKKGSVKDRKIQGRT